jgi:hypothetical protein
MTQLNVAALQSADCASPAERRAFVRYPCSLESNCHPLSASGQEWAGQVENVSRGGVALVLNRRFELKTLLAIELLRPNGEPARRVFARVVHVHRRADGNWMLGCAFANELSEEDLKALL